MKITDLSLRDKILQTVCLHINKDNFLKKQNHIRL